MNDGGEGFRRRWRGSRNLGVTQMVPQTVVWIMNALNIKQSMCRVDLGCWMTCNEERTSRY